MGFTLVISISSAVLSLEESPKESSFFEQELLGAKELHFWGSGVAGTSSSEDVPAFIVSNDAAGMIVLVAIFIPLDSLELSDAA